MKKKTYKFIMFIQECIANHWDGGTVKAER